MKNIFEPIEEQPEVEEQDFYVGDLGDEHTEQVVIPESMD